MKLCEIFFYVGGKIGARDGAVDGFTESGWSKFGDLVAFLTSRV